MVSIKEVAEAAGVSTATVSRVLSNGLHVRPEVRAHVMATVERLGYRPNLVARSLRSQQSNTLGLVVFDIRNPFFTSISRAVEDVAYEQRFSVFLCNTDENPEKEAIYLHLMRDEGVAGVIFSPTRQAVTTFSASNLNFPTVVVDRSIPNGDVDVVQLDNIDAAYRLTAHLIENGYRRIAALCGETSTTGQERRLGYEKALRAHGLSPAAELVKYVQPKIEAGYAAALKMLDSAPSPDAGFTTNSLVGAGRMQSILGNGPARPGDIVPLRSGQTTPAPHAPPP